MKAETAKRCSFVLPPTDVTVKFRFDQTSARRRKQRTHHHENQDAQHETKLTIRTNSIKIPSLSTQRLTNVEF